MAPLAIERRTAAHPEQAAGPGGVSDLLAAARHVAAWSGARAAAQDAGAADLRPDIQALARAGLLTAPLPATLGGLDLAHHPSTTGTVVTILSTLGAANLSLARLYEGHVNAVKLLVLYGSRAQLHGFADSLQDGGMYGVWGADGAAPAQLEGSAARLRLRGSKRYASGAGLLRGAVVPVRDLQGRQQLLLLDTAGEGRADPGAWRMQGMRATQSGSYDLDGLAISESRFLGPPDCYRREPWFNGGIWRCAAAQLGAIERVVAELEDHLHAQRRLADPAQLKRLGRAMIAARSARYWVEDAAVRVEAQVEEPAGRDAAVALAGMARLEVERCALDAMQLAQRSIGLALFDERHPLERVMRDLAVYLRQAAPDALLLECTQGLLRPAHR